ncbi:MAG: inorganic phosphate transporter [Acidobacteria bacterium]|nr:inorganic phosphate transporter [Acidobacteriota bacterium]
MNLLLIAAVGLLSYANGANDNFKGVATLWGAGRTSYWRALSWATAFTFLGSLAAAGTASLLVSKFNGSKFVGAEIYTQLPFLAAVALGGAVTVLLASRLGLPVSTTHALTGALAGAGVMAAGFAGVKFAALGSGVVVPLLFSPFVALALTLGVHPIVARLASRDCVCVTEPQAMTLAPDGAAAMESASSTPMLRVAGAAECNTGAEIARGSLTDTLHWLSGAGISFARGLNDTPKIAAVLLVAAAATVKLNFVLVAVAMAMGGMLGAARVAQTMSKQITPMATEEAVSANLVAASLVMLASFFALPVSTTHVTSGGIFGIGLRRRGEADWKRVREILLAWAGTLPLGAALGGVVYLILVRLA